MTDKRLYPEREANQMPFFVPNDLGWKCHNDISIVGAPVQWKCTITYARFCRWFSFVDLMWSVVRQTRWDGQFWTSPRSRFGSNIVAFRICKSEGAGVLHILQYVKSHFIDAHQFCKRYFLVFYIRFTHKTSFLIMPLEICPGRGVNFRLAIRVCSLVLSFSIHWPIVPTRLVEVQLHSTSAARSQGVAMRMRAAKVATTYQCGCTWKSHRRAVKMGLGSENISKPAHNECMQCLSKAKFYSIKLERMVCFCYWWLISPITKSFMCPGPGRFTSPFTLSTNSHYKGFCSVITPTFLLYMQDLRLRKVIRFETMSMSDVFLGADK